MKHRKVSVVLITMMSLTTIGSVTATIVQAAKVNVKVFPKKCEIRDINTKMIHEDCENILTVSKLNGHRVSTKASGNNIDRAPHRKEKRVELYNIAQLFLTNMK